jgi:hypothetical protein
MYNYFPHTVPPRGPFVGCIDEFNFIQKIAVCIFSPKRGVHNMSNFMFTLAMGSDFFSVGSQFILKAGSQFIPGSGVSVNSRKWGLGLFPKVGSQFIPGSGVSVSSLFPKWDLQFICKVRHIMKGFFQ